MAGTPACRRSTGQAGSIAQAGSSGRSLCPPHPLPHVPRVPLAALPPSRQECPRGTLMAIIEQPPRTLELPPAGVAAPRQALGVFRRPSATTGWKSWAFTVDHKKIGLMYGFTAFAFFIIGGSEALLIRLQLARPNGRILSAGTYNELFTMHG